MHAEHQSNPPALSIVSPVYGAENIVAELVRRINQAVEQCGITHEIVLVEDRSPDASWEEIVQQCEKHPNVLGVRLSRNFGQHNAIDAGLEIARGDWVLVMDCDLQQDPAYIPQLWDARNGSEIVFTRSKTREHSSWKNTTAQLYYSMLASISNFNLDPNIGSFSLISRKVVEAYLDYGDYRKHYLPTLAWLGFSSRVVEIEHAERYAGKSGYSFWDLIRHALNVTVSNSDRLLYVAVYLGGGFSVASAFAVLLLVVRYFLVGGGLEGWTSLMVTIVFFSGLILSSIGLVGVYIAKIFEQTKQRKRYVVETMINVQEPGARQ